MTEVADTSASRRQSWRNAWVLIAAQAILGSQMSMIFIVGGLAGAMLAPNRCLATLPVSMVDELPSAPFPPWTKRCSPSSREPKARKLASAIP